MFSHVMVGVNDMEMSKTFYDSILDTLGHKEGRVEAWHAAGLANGGSLCEDPPGVREGGATKLYLAYLRDPAGNKICATYRFT